VDHLLNQIALALAPGAMQNLPFLTTSLTNGARLTLRPPPFGGIALQVIDSGSV